MNKLSISDLEKVSGGNYETARKYIEELMAKYGVDNTNDLNKLMTEEETDMLFYKMAE